MDLNLLYTIPLTGVDGGNKIFWALSIIFGALIILFLFIKFKNKK